MSCRRIKRWIPLAAGEDLSPKKRAELLSHLNECPDCREEFRAFTSILESTREWLAADRAEWREKDWKQSVRAAEASAGPGTFPLVPWPFRRIWAYTVMALSAVLLFLFIAQPRFIGRRADYAGGAASLTSENTKDQDVLQMTLISHETGLQIQWFFNKDFEWKENK